MAAYKTFNEFWSVGLGRTCFTDYEARRAEKVWDAAIKSVEENGNSLQQRKGEICASCEDVMTVRNWITINLFGFCPQCGRKLSPVA